MSIQPPPLKILHVISGDLWAGAEVQALTLLSALQKIEGVELAVALLNNGELANRLRAKNIPVSIFDERSLNGLRIFGELQKLMRRWHPDIVHTHRIKENVLGSLANLLSGNACCLRTVHGAGEHKLGGLRQIAKNVLIGIDRFCGNYLQQRIVAVSNDLAVKLATDFHRDKIVVIENGVDIELVEAGIHPVDFKIDAPAATHIGIVGRLVPVKRVDLFLQMAALLKAQQPRTAWRFHILGDGPLRASLITQAQQLGIDDICVFHGHRNDIIACMAALNALVICSDHEGLPMTVLEAMVLDIPIVAHAIGGMTDILKRIDNATLVDSHTASSYAQAVVAALESEMGRGCQTVTRKQISADNNAAKMLRLYQEMRKKTTANGPEIPL